MADDLIGLVAAVHDLASLIQGDLGPGSNARGFLRPQQVPLEVEHHARVLSGQLIHGPDNTGGDDLPSFPRIRLAPGAFLGTEYHVIDLQPMVGLVELQNVPHALHHALDPQGGAGAVLLLPGGITLDILPDGIVAPHPPAPFVAFLVPPIQADLQIVGFDEVQLIEVGVDAIMKPLALQPSSNGGKVRGNRGLPSSSEDKAQHSEGPQPLGIGFELGQGHGIGPALQVPPPVCAVGTSVVAVVRQEDVGSNGPVISGHPSNMGQHLIASYALHEAISPFGISRSVSWGRSTPSRCGGVSGCSCCTSSRP